MGKSHGPVAFCAFLDEFGIMQIVAISAEGKVAGKRKLQTGTMRGKGIDMHVVSGHERSWLGRERPQCVMLD